MDKETKFSLFDFCKKHAARVEIYGKETLDEEGEIIPFIEQAAIITHYLHVRNYIFSHFSRIITGLQDAQEQNRTLQTAFWILDIQFYLML